LLRKQRKTLVGGYFILPHPLYVCVCVCASVLRERQTDRENFVCCDFSWKPKQLNSVHCAWPAARTCLSVCRDSREWSWWRSTKSSKQCTYYTWRMFVFLLFVQSFCTI